MDYVEIAEAAVWVYFLAVVNAAEKFLERSVLDPDFAKNVGYNPVSSLDIDSTNVFLTIFPSSLSPTLLT